MEFFGDLEDPRIERCKRHQLLDIITIAICAVNARRIAFGLIDCQFNCYNALSDGYVKEDGQW